MKVIATAIGFDGIALRAVDEEFDVPDNTKLDGVWFKKVGDKKNVAPITPEADALKDTLPTSLLKDEEIKEVRLLEAAAAAAALTAPPPANAGTGLA